MSYSIKVEPWYNNGKVIEIDIVLLKADDQGDFEVSRDSITRCMLEDLLLEDFIAVENS